jgi:uncharacterized membrane protein YphA (DoxX/SURF4 family)
MQRWLRWVATVATVAYGGPGLVDPSDIDLSLPPADDGAARWVTRSAIVAPLVVVVLFLVGAAWPIVAVVAAILLLPLMLNRIRVLRGR